jgi:HAD superfamily hydrolase (TIGR01490 family)
MSRKVAVFDIDGTIFRSSLLIELVEQLIREKIFPKSAERIYAKEYRLWLDRKDSYDKYIWAVVGAFEHHIKGVDEKHFLKVVNEVNNQHKDRVYRYTRDLVRELKRKNYFLLAISHSPKYIVEGFAKQIGFDKVYGRFLELDRKSRFTGKTLHLDVINEKSNVLLRAVEKEGLTLKGSYGVGDTESDVSFLKLVEHPICFNPNRELYAAAKRRGWKVVVERKDVIYEL